LIVDGSRDDLLAASSLAQEISSDVWGEIVYVDEVVSSSHWDQVSLSDGDGLEVEALWLVVLSGFNDASDDDLSVSDTGGLEVVGVRSDDVGSNSVVGSNGSGSGNVEDNSLDDAGEWGTLDGDILRSGQGNQPGSSELAVLGDVPVDVVEDGGGNLDDVHGGCAVIASEDEAIASRSGDRVLGVGSKRGDLVGGFDKVSLGVIKVGKRNDGVGILDGLEVSWGIEDSVNKNGSIVVSFSSVDRSVSVGGISSNDEIEP